MGVAEQLAIYLYAITTDLFMRKLAEIFQRSTETIQRTYYRIMRHFLHPSIYKSALKNTSADAPLHWSIEENRNFFYSFKDCMGAVDGTHRSGDIIVVKIQKVDGKGKIS